MSLEIHPVAAETPPSTESARVDSMYVKLDEVLGLSPTVVVWSNFTYEASGVITYLSHDESTTELYFARKQNGEKTAGEPVLLIPNGRIWSPIAYIYPARQSEPAMLIAGKEANNITDITELEEVVHRLYHGDESAESQLLLSEQKQALEDEVVRLHAELNAVKESLAYERDPRSFAQLHGISAARARYEDKKRSLRGQISLYP